MNEKTVLAILKNRKRNSFFLTLEGIYAIILLFSVLFCFPLFILELKIQFILISTFYLINWIIIKFHKHSYIKLSKRFAVIFYCKSFYFHIKKGVHFTEHP